MLLRRKLPKVEDLTLKELYNFFFTFAKGRRTNNSFLLNNIKYSRFNLDDIEYYGSIIREIIDPECYDKEYYRSFFINGIKLHLMNKVYFICLDFDVLHYWMLSDNPYQSVEIIKNKLQYRENYDGLSICNTYSAAKRMECIYHQKALLYMELICGFMVINQLQLDDDVKWSIKSLLITSPHSFTNIKLI